MIWFLELLIVGVSTGRIGTQSGKQLPVDTFDQFLLADEFISKYMRPARPVLFKGVAKEFPAFSKWNDEYFQSSYDASQHIVEVEQGKKENRGDESHIMSLANFVRSYKNEDIYCVSRLPPFLAADLPVYKPIDCPFILNNLMRDIVLWYSSGGTKSVWHNDAYENINCLLRGRKEFILANRSETKEKAHIDRPEEGFSSVDVDDVDTQKYPGFKDMVFYNVTMEAGDCMYIPWLWFHQVNSIDSNLAVNVWWETYRTPLDCDITYNDKTWDSVHFHDNDRKIGIVAQQSLYMHHTMYNNTFIEVNDFFDVMGEVMDDFEMNHVSDGAIFELFDLVDINNDKTLTYEEIDSIREVLPKYLLLFKDEL